MNQRIKELAEQATIKTSYQYQTWGDRIATDYKEQFDKEKFAELIIKKCLEQCYCRGMNDELYAGQLKAAAYIEEYFGVE